LLSQVASEVAKIEQPEEREEIIGSTQLLAGLRFEADLIRNLFQGGLMRESTVFQEILQEGRDEGKQEQALATIYRLLPRRIGTVAPELQQRLLQLSLPQLEDLTEALLDFSRPEDLIAWLDRVEAIRIEVLRKGRLTTIDRLLPRRIGTVAPELQQRLLELSLPQLEDLTEALLDFEEPNDLIAWLDALQDG
jgi:predicted transposase YdaD